MMANTGRTLLEATVTDVGAGPYVYPACGQCYSKLVFVRIQDCQLHRCQNCGRSYSHGQEQFRYRLCLTVTDGTAVASLTTFGGMLNSFFGVPATKFHMLMSSAEAKYGSSHETIVQAALEQAFIGQRMLFGLKTVSSNTREKHPQTNIAHSAISLRDICRSTVTSLHKSTGRHLPDFIALQIMPVTDSSFSATVVDCMQHLEATIQACNLTPEACSNKAALLQMWSLCPSSQEHSLSNSIIRHVRRSPSKSFMGHITQSPSDTFLRSVIQSPAINSSCDAATDSNFDQSSLAFSCDNSEDTIFVPKRPCLTKCTSHNPELAICLPDSEVSAIDEGQKCLSHHENEESVRCYLFYNEDENRNSEIRNCLTTQQADNSEGILKKRHCELVGVCKCKTRSSDNFTNSTLCDQSGVTRYDFNGAKKHTVKIVCDQSDVDSNNVKIVCGQNDINKNNGKTVCDHSDVYRNSEKIICHQSDIDRQCVKTVHYQSDINRHNMKAVCCQSVLHKHKEKAVCKQKDTNRLSCVCTSTNNKHKLSYGKEYCKNQDNLNLENKENVSQNNHLTSTPCQTRHSKQKYLGCNCHFSVHLSPVSVKKVSIHRMMFRKQLIKTHALCQDVSLNTETEGLACTSCPLNVKDHMEICGLSDSCSEKKLTTDLTEQSQQKAHSKHGHLRLSHYDQSIIDVTLNNEGLHTLASDADGKYKCQKYDREIGAVENTSQIREVVEDIPEEFMEEFATHLMEECLSKDTSSKLEEDFPESEGLDVFLSQIGKDVPSKVMENYEEYVRPDFLPVLLSKDNPLKLTKDKSSNLRGGHPSELMESTPSKLWEDYPESEGLEVFLSKMEEDNLSKLMEGTTPKLWGEDYLELTRPDSLPMLRKDNHKLPEGTPSKLWENYTESVRPVVSLPLLGEDTPSNFREDKSSKLMNDSIPKLGEYPKSEWLNLFPPNLREDKTLKVIQGSPQCENLDVFLSPLGGDNLTKLTEDLSSTLMEIYPESEGFDAFLSKLREDTTSQLREDYPESEGVNVYRRKLNSSIIDHRKLQGQNITAEKRTNCMLTKKLDDNADESADYREMMYSMQPSCVECEHVSCDTVELGTSAVKLPSVVPLSSSNLDEAKKQTISQLVKNSQKQCTFQSDKSCRKVKTFSDITALQESGLSLSYKNSFTQSASQDIQSFNNQDTSQDIQSFKNQDTSQDIQSFNNQDTSQDIQSFNNQGTSQDIQSFKNQDTSQDVYSFRNQSTSQDVQLLRNHGVSQNIKIIKKHGAAWNNKPLLKEDLSKNAKPFMKEDISKNAKPFMKEDISKNAKPFMKEDVSKNAKPFMKEDISKNAKPFMKEDAKPFMKEDVSKNFKPSMKEDVYKNVKSLTKKDLFPNIKTVKKKDLSKPDIDREKQTLFRAVQARHKTTEGVRDVKKHKLLPNITDAHAEIVFPPFQNDENSCTTKIVNTVFNVGDADICDNSEKLSMSKAIGSRNKQTLFQTVGRKNKQTLFQIASHAEKEMSLKKDKHSTEQTLLLQAVNSVKTPDKCAMLQKQIVSHSEKLTLGGKVTNGKKLILPSQNQEKNTLPEFNKNTKRHTFLQRVASLGKQPATLSGTSQIKYSSQQPATLSGTTQIECSSQQPATLSGTRQLKCFSQQPATLSGTRQIMCSSQQPATLSGTRQIMCSSQQPATLSGTTQIKCFSQQPATLSGTRQIKGCSQQPASLSGTTQIKGSSQQTVNKSKKQTLSVNCTARNQKLKNLITPAKGGFFSEYVTPMKIPQPNMNSSRKIMQSVNSAIVKQQASRRVKNSAGNFLSLKYATPQLQNFKDVRRKYFVNYATPKQSLQCNRENSETILSSHFTTPKQSLQCKRKNCEKILSSNCVRPKQQQKSLKCSGEHRCPTGETPKSQISHLTILASENFSLARNSKNIGTVELKLAGNTSTAEYDTQVMIGNKSMIETDTQFMVCNKSTVENDTQSIVCDKSTVENDTQSMICNKSTVENDTQSMVCNKSTVEYGTQPIDIQAMSMNVTLRRSKRKYHTDKLNDQVSTNMIGREHTSTEALCTDQVKDYTCCLADRPTGKMSRLSHLDSSRESQEIFQVTESLLLVNSGFYEKNIGISFWRDSSNISDRSFQNYCRSISNDNLQPDSKTLSNQNLQADSSRVFDRTAQKDNSDFRKDSTRMSDKNFEKGSVSISETDIRCVQKDSSSLSHSNIGQDSSLFHSNGRKDSSLSHSSVGKDNTNLSDSNFQKDSTSSSHSNVQKDSTSSSHSNVQKDSTSSSHSNVQKDSTSSSRSNVQEDSTSSSHSNVQKDSTSSSHSNVQKDSTSSSHSNVQKDSSLSHSNVQKDSSSSHSNVQKDSTSSSHSNVQKDSSSSHSNVQKDSTSSSHRIVQKDSSSSHSSVQKDSSPSHSNVGKDNTNLSDSYFHKDSSSFSHRDNLKDSPDCPLSGRKSTVYGVDVCGPRTTFPEISPQIRLHGYSAMDAFPVSIVEKTNKSVCVTSEVSSQGCVFDNLSGKSVYDYRQEELLNGSRDLVQGKGKIATRQIAYLGSGCNTESMDVNNHFRKIMDVNDHVVDIMDMCDVAEVTDIKGHVAQVMDMKDHLTEITDMKGHVTEVRDMKGHKVDMKGHLIEVTDMKGHLQKVMNTNGRFTEILNVNDSVAEIMEIDDCLTEITDLNNEITEITDLNNDIADIDNDVVGIMDITEIVTGGSLLKDVSESSDVLFDCTDHDVSNGSSVRELDVRSEKIGNHENNDFNIRERNVRSPNIGNIQFGVEDVQLHCRGTEGHTNCEHLSIESSSYSDVENEKPLICATYLQRDYGKSLICATCSQRECDKPFVCDLESTKASIDSGMYQKSLQVTEAASDVYSSQAITHPATDIDKVLPADVDEVLSDSLRDLFSSQEDDSIFVSATSHANEFGNETCEDMVHNTLLLTESNVDLVRLDQSCSESKDSSSVISRCQRGKSGDMIQETLLLHETNLTSGDYERNYSKNHMGNASRRNSSTKKVRFSYKDQEHSYFPFEAISSQPVATEATHYLKSSLKKGTTEWELDGSQDLFSESSEDLAPGNAFMPMLPSSCCTNAEWNSSIDLFSQTPDKPQKCLLLSPNMTSAGIEPVFFNSNSPGVSHLGGIVVCAEPHTLEADGSFDLFTPSPLSRNKINSVSLFSPEVYSYPVQVCMTPDLFS